MKTSILILALASLSLSSCNAQDKNDNDSEKNSMSFNSEEQAPPKGSWKVNREFDEDGNLISYDSTYTYSYSNINGDSLPDAEMEEIQRHFESLFRNNERSAAMMHRFMNDSLTTGNDFFNNRFFMNDAFSRDFQEQMRKMDSIHQQMLIDHFSRSYIEDKKRIPAENDSGSGTI